MLLKNTMKCLAALFVMAGPLYALTEADTIENAVALAAKENRIVMVEFTGTDWCTACKHLHGKILSSPEFEQAVGGKYVVVQVDYPRLPELVAKIPVEERNRREALLNSYGVRGLPSMVFMDSKGMPFAIVSGTRRTPAEFLEVLKETDATLAARDAAFAKAAGLSGMEKATALAEGLNALPRTCRDKYVDVVNEINANDPQNSLGYKYILGTSERRIEQVQTLRDLIAAHVGKYDPESVKQQIAELDAFLAREDLLPEIRQDAYQSKSSCYSLLRDLDAMLVNLKLAYEAAPESRKAPRLAKDIKYTEDLIARLKAEAESKKSDK